MNEHGFRWWWQNNTQGRISSKFPDICWGKTPEKPQPEIGPIVARTLDRRVICNDVILDHNGGFILELI